MLRRRRRRGGGGKREIEFDCCCASHAEGKIIDLDAFKSDDDDVFVVAGTSNGSVCFYRGTKLELLGVEMIKDNAVSDSNSAVVTCAFCKIRPEEDKVGGALFIGNERWSCCGLVLDVYSFSKRFYIVFDHSIVFSFELICG